ncbi:MAG: YceI family protein [Balneolaceae bacterium]|nr:MAG: YceI family protein [Balneolaceae bacterium]
MTNSGHAEFTSRVPLHTFTGESGYLTGMIDYEENIIDFYLDLNTLRTGIDRRDRDMFRTLNVDEYPFAEFTGEFETLPDLQSAEKQFVVVVGEFTVNGVTQNLIIEGSIQSDENGIVLAANWNLLLKDYEIEPPGILFYRVNDEVNIHVKALLKPQKREESLNNN